MFDADPVFCSTHVVNLDTLTQSYVFVFLIFPSLCMTLRKIAPPSLGPRSCAGDKAFFAKKRQDATDHTFRDVMAMLALYHHRDFGLAPCWMGASDSKNKLRFPFPPVGFTHAA